jgi:arylsulfatase A-like enzyme
MTIRDSMSLGKDLKTDSWPERKEALKKEHPQGDDLVRWKYQAYMRDYLACIADIDENVGRLLKYLKDSGLEENTIVMYSSDQGFYLGEHGWFDKRFMYEESYRTPLIARWPGVIKPGSQNDDLVQNIDLAETFLDIAGAPIPGDMQGRSMVPLMQGTTPPTWRSTLYYHYYEYPTVDHSARRHEGVSDKRYKLIRFYGLGVPGGEEWEFYDLQTDPQEMKSIYGDTAQSERIAGMKAELKRLRQVYNVPQDHWYDY